MELDTMMVRNECVGRHIPKGAGLVHFLTPCEALSGIPDVSFRAGYNPALSFIEKQLSEAK